MGKVAGVAIYSPVGNQTVNARDYVEIGCDSNYYLSGSSNMTCLANGTFDKTPSCIPKTPPANCTGPTINFATIKRRSDGFMGGGMVPGPDVADSDYMSVTCLDGYAPTGNGLMGCSNGTWNYTVTCNRELMIWALIPSFAPNKTI